MTQRKMKMYSIIMFLAACMLSLTSCDKENNAIITNEIQTKANIFDDFLCSIDSLNREYDQKNLTRGQTTHQNLDQSDISLEPNDYSIRRIGMVCAADWAGKVAGHYGGQWTGGVLGATVTGGNPIGVIAGSWIGKKYGATIGGTIASAVVRELCSFQITVSSTMSDIYSQNLNGVQDFVYNINLHCGSNDSLGYYHNLVMYKILGNPQKYENGDTLNLSLLYDDIVICLAELIGEDKNLLLQQETKEFFLIQTKKFYEKGELFYNGIITYDELLCQNEDILVHDFMVDSSTAYKCKQLASKVYHEISELSNEQVQCYAIDFQNVVNASNLCDSDRELAISNTQILLNSKLCWTANKIVE